MRENQEDKLRKQVRDILKKKEVLFKSLSRDFNYFRWDKDCNGNWYLSREKSSDKIQENNDTET